MADILGMQQGIIGALSPLMKAQEQKDESQKEKDKRRAERSPLLSSAQEAEAPTGAVVSSLRKGGRVKKTGNYRVHKGERVVGRRSVSRSKRG